LVLNIITVQTVYNPSTINNFHYHRKTHHNTLLPYLTAFIVVSYLENTLMTLNAVMEFTRLYRVKR